MPVVLHAFAPGALAGALCISGVLAGEGGGQAVRPQDANFNPRDIVEFFPDATLVIDNEGTVLAWNKAMEDLTGVPAKDVIGKGDYEYALAFYGRRRPILIDLIGMPLEQVKALYSEVRIKDGKLEAMTENVRLKGRDVVLWGVTGRLYGPDGEAAGAIESIRDVTDQVRSERELKKAREELERRVEERTFELARARGILQATLETIPVGVAVADASDGRISYATRSMTDTFGHELAGIDICSDVKPFRIMKADGSPLAPEEQPLNRSLFSGEHITAEEIQVRRADGSVITTLVNSAPVPGQDGGIAAGVVCVMDISERKKAEVALAESEEKFRVLAETLASAVFIYQDGKLSYVNPAMVKITGYDKVELRDMGYWGFVHPDHEEMVRQRGIDRLSGVPVPSRYEAKILTRGGEERWLDIAAALIEYNGRPAGLMTAFDITERKKAEEALMESKRQAELYLDLMGHDINNMNQIAQGYLEMAGDTSDDRTAAVVSKAVEMLRNSSGLISSLRKIQRARGEAVKLERTDLSAILCDVTDEFSMTPGRDIAIARNVPPGCAVMANPLLKDVFANIVGNAIKHSTGSLNLGITVDKTDGLDGVCYRVSVEDNGPGIPDGIKENVFDRLARGRTDARGHGLGLYLVRTLVEGFHGRVWVEDRVEGEYARGCRFVVLLPAAPAGNTKGA